MRFDSVELKNVCIHRNFSCTFQSGLLGLVGPQGSGKSTLLHAMFAAITNDFSRVMGGKNGAICQQATQSEPAYVRLKLSHLGREYEIFRQIAPTVKHLLRVSDGTELTRDADIRERLTADLGLDRDMLDRYVFVPQWGLRDLFQQTPAERGRTLSHLCGTQQAEKLWALLGQQLTADAVTAVGPSEDVKDVRRELEDADAEIARLRLRCAELSELADRSEYDRVGAAVASLRAYVAAYAEEARCLQELNELRTQLTPLAAAAQQAQAALEELQSKQQRLETAIAKLERSQAAQAAIKQAQRAVTRQEQQLAAQEVILQQKPPACPVDQATVLEERTALLDEQQELRAMLRRWEALSENSNACPTCGQPVTNVQEHRKELLQRQAAIEKALAPLQLKYEEWRAWQKVCQQLQAAQATAAELKTALQVELQEAKEDLAGLPAAADYDAEKLADYQSRRQRVQQKLSKAQTTLTKSQQQHAAIEGRIAALQADSERALQKCVETQAAWKELRAQLPETLRQPVEDADFFAACERWQQAWRESREQQIALQTSLKHRLEQRKLTEARYKTLRKRAARAKRGEQWLQQLHAARSVFYRDNLPRLVHQAALATLESGINGLLDQFDSPFVVEATDDLSYTAHFRNGTVMPAAGLSGGQQTVLAMAFRSALNSLFASQIGVLVLDEPTAGLDRRHVDLLREALVMLGSQARERNCQILIVTHETALMTAFEQTISLNKMC